MTATNDTLAALLQAPIPPPLDGMMSTETSAWITRYTDWYMTDRREALKAMGDDRLCSDQCPECGSPVDIEMLRGVQFRPCGACNADLFILRIGEREVIDVSPF